MDYETKFLANLLELQYGGDVASSLKEIAKDVWWAKGWPEDNIAFWNAEAFMWGSKISSEKKSLIKQELGHLKGKNLDLGCGAYSYVKSTGLDFSPQMLKFNEQIEEGVIGNLEENLPFADENFASATAVFVFNYVKNYWLLISEIYRIVKDDLVVVLSAKKVNDWQHQKEVNLFPAEKWVNILREAGFAVDFVEKDNLWFFKCQKRALSRKTPFCILAP